MNFDRMRALLLDQAIRGELVPQLAEEGAVEIGAIAPEAFKLPKTWKWLTLKSLVIPTKQIIPEESFTYLDVSSIKKFQIDEIKRLDPSNAPSRARKVVQPGMVLFATVRPYLKNICVSPELPGQVIASTAFATMTCSKDLNNRYLFYFLRSDFFMDLVKSKQRGISYPAISEKDFYALPVPVPPLDEQIRIVAKLDEAITEIDRAEKAYQELQTLSGVLRGQILQKAIQGKLVPQLDCEEAVEQIGDAPENVPFAIPEKWKWCHMKWITQKIHYGFTASAAKNGNAKLLRITDIQDGRVNWETVPFCDVPEKKLTTCKLEENDVVIARTGGTIGKSFLLTGVNDVAVFASYLIRLIPSTVVVDPKYLMVFLNSPEYWKQLKAMSQGTGQPNVNAKSLSTLQIPLPPLEEQARIVAKIEELLKQVDALSGK